jgi:hypothetical protein
MVKALPPNAREQHVKAWLKALHARCNVNALEKQHEDYATNLYDMLGQFTREFFTQDGYRWVASECPKGAPNAAQLIALLTAWGREHLGISPIGTEAQAYVNTFDRRWAEGADREKLLDMARAHYPREAWAEIKRKYHVADPDETREVMTDDQREEMKAKIKQGLAEMRANIKAREAGNPLPYPVPWTDFPSDKTTPDPREAQRTGKRYRPVYRGAQQKTPGR